MQYDTTGLHYTTMSKELIFGLVCGFKKSIPKILPGDPFTSVSQIRKSAENITVLLSIVRDSKQSKLGVKYLIQLVPLMSVCQLNLPAAACIYRVCESSRAASHRVDSSRVMNGAPPLS